MSDTDYICPFLNDKCEGPACRFWLRDEQEEFDGCRLWRVLCRMDTLADRVMFAQAGGGEQQEQKPESKTNGLFKKIGGWLVDIVGKRLGAKLPEDAGMSVRNREIIEKAQKSMRLPPKKEKEK